MLAVCFSPENITVPGSLDNQEFESAHEERRVLDKERGLNTSRLVIAASHLSFLYFPLPGSDNSNKLFLSLAAVAL